MIVTAYFRIHFDIHLRQYIKLIVCVFVVLKATEGRKAHKGKPAYPRIQLFQGYSFEVAGYSAVTPLTTYNYCCLNPIKLQSVVKWSIFLES